jgi:hypothetical protein
LKESTSSFINSFGGDLDRLLFRCIEDLVLVAKMTWGCMYLEPMAMAMLPQCQ